MKYTWNVCAKAFKHTNEYQSVSQGLEPLFPLEKLDYSLTCLRPKISH